jgi:diguanylate cyclase (GGDEF)-like protein
MTPAPAAAGKNIKNAVASMIRIFAVGSDFLTKEQADILVSKGAVLDRFKTVNNIVFRPENKPDLILINKKQAKEPSFKSFIDTFKDVPKIVFSGEPKFRGFTEWLKVPFTYPAVDPSSGELAFLIKKALREREISLENKKLRTALANLKQELDFFEEVSKTLTSTLDLSNILSTIMKNAKKLIKAEAWSFLLVDQETGDLVFEKTSGKKADRKKIKKVRLKIGEGIAGWVAQELIPVVVPDVSTDPRFSSKIDRQITLKTKSIMCVPIKSKDNILGVLEIVNKTTKEPFTKDDLSLILRIVDHAAIAIERVSLYQKMEELSITDDLTKLFNTRYLDRTLEIEINRSNRHHTSLSLIFMDVDHFKTINDNYGHLVGSKLLVEMGQLLIKCLRTVDIVARYGGDEFVIVLPQTPPSSAIQIAERIRRTMEQNVFLKRDGYSLKLTASFGVASYPESAKSKEELLRLADEAMYRVKYQTRNGVYAIV